MEIEWQPVRIAPPPDFECVPGPPPSQELYEGRRKDTGKIVRVRPCVTTMPGVFICGGRVFQVHPDDIQKLNNCGWCTYIEICEHQIQAD
jgi:hypothetical protein